LPSQSFLDFLELGPHAVTARLPLDLEITPPRFAANERHDPVFENAGSQPFLDEPEDARVADPVLQEADHPLLGDLREERPDIGVEYEVHLPAADPACC